MAKTPLWENESGSTIKDRWEKRRNQSHGVYAGNSEAKQSDIQGKKKNVIFCD